MTRSAIDSGASLLDAIRTKDPMIATTAIQEYRNGMKDTSLGADYVVWITEPANLMLVQKTITESLEVPQRVMAIRRAQMSRTQKAVSLIQAMEMAIKKVHKL